MPESNKPDLRDLIGDLVPIERYGFSLQDVKAWREKEESAGRPSGYADFLENHGLCIICKSGGLFLLPPKVTGSFVPPARALAALRSGQNRGRNRGGSVTSTSLRINRQGVGRPIGDGDRNGRFFACVAVNLHRINGFLRWPDLRQRCSTLKVGSTKVFQSEEFILELPTCLAPQSGSVPYSPYSLVGRRSGKEGRRGWRKRQPNRASLGLPRRVG